MTPTTRVVREPKPGLVYEIAVHGEPPEGAEVWWNVVGELQRWKPGRGRYDPYWMLAPVPADPPVEEPAFPLSREAFGDWRRDPLKLHHDRRGPFWEWLIRVTITNYDTAVAAWRAAGCPGADTGAPAEEQEEAEGTEGSGPRWKWLDQGDQDCFTLLDRQRSNGHAFKAFGGTCEPSTILEYIVSDANAYHREKAAREEAETTIEQLHEFLCDDDDGRPPRVQVCAAVRSLVDRAEKAEKDLGVRTRQFHNALANETNLGRQARKLKEALDASKKVKLYEPRLLPTDYASCATPSHGEDG